MNAETANLLNKKQFDDETFTSLNIEFSAVVDREKSFGRWR